MQLGNDIAARTAPDWTPRRRTAKPTVWLVRPPQLFFFGVWPRGPRLSLPLGLLSIGSFLRHQGLDVRLYDCFVEGDENEQIERDAEARAGSRAGFLKRWVGQHDDAGVTPYDLDTGKEAKGLGFGIRSWIKWINREESSNRDRERDDLVHFGASWEQLERDLREGQPDIVGITNQFRENTQETLRTASLVRQVLPDATIVVGGPNATALPDHMLTECEAIDMIALGDGEDTMLEIVELVQGKRPLADVRSVVMRAAKGYYKAPSRSLASDLDVFGHIDYDLARMERYFRYEKGGMMARQKFDYDGAHRTVSLVTSRGCPYKCSFCSIHIHAGRKYRRYSVEHILDHMENLVRNYDVRHFHLEDDNLTLDKDRFMQLMNGVVERGLAFTWDTPNGVFANTIDEDMLRLMKRTGVTYLVIGVESGDQNVLDTVIYKQPLTIEHVLRVFKLGKKVGVDMQAFYIIGFPRETLADIKTTLKFALDGLIKYNVLPHMAIARPDPGTELFREANENGHLVADRARQTGQGTHTDTFVRYMVKNDAFTPETIVDHSNRFHMKAIAMIALQSIGYLIRHPVVAGRCLGYFFRNLAASGGRLNDALVKLFFCKLFYRNTLLGERDLADARAAVDLQPKTSAREETSVEREPAKVA